MSNQVPAPRKLAFLFPGQGSQTVGMAREFYETFPSARAVFDEADAALGFPLSRVIFDGPEDQLKLTENTQPAILTASIAITRVFTEQLAARLGPGHVPSFAAGHSLGEYSAHVTAGTLSFAEAVRTVRKRGEYMQEAVPAGEGTMAAILGLPVDEINDCCGRAMDELDAEITRSTFTSTESSTPLAGSASARSVTSDPTLDPVSMAFAARSTGSIVTPANLNAPEQTVISGATAAVTRAAELCKEAGAKRTVMLPVSAPFHCSLMKPAQERLSADLEAIAFHDPCFPVISNVDARCIGRSSDARDCLIRQVTGPVRWVECVQILVREGVTHTIELGPGRVLTSLMRQIDRNPVALNVEDLASLEKTLTALAGA